MSWADKVWTPAQRVDALARRVERLVFGLDSRLPNSSLRAGREILSELRSWLGNGYDARLNELIWRVEEGLKALDERTAVNAN